MFSRPCLEIESVRKALDAMRQAEPLGFAHPLAHFISIRHSQASAVDGDAAIDAEIFHGLSGLIRHRLNHHRNLYHLPPVSLSPEAGAMQTEIARLKEDFQQSNAELEAWSTLYYRYVRVDFDLSMDQLETFTGRINAP